MEGEGVDLVVPGDEVALPDGSIDLAISCECFEHNPRWVETFRNMHRMTMPGGLVLVTCASTGRREHGTARTTPAQSPGTTARGWDYYRNLSRRDFEEHFRLAEMFERHAFFRNDVSKDLYFIGRREGAASPLSRFDFGAFWSELDSVNTLVIPDQPFRTRRLFGRLLEMPLKWAERLPERGYQEVALRWPAIERSIKARFSRRTWNRPRGVGPVLTPITGERRASGAGAGDRNRDCASGPDRNPAPHHRRDRGRRHGRDRRRSHRRRRGTAR